MWSSLVGTVFGDAADPDPLICPSYQ
jgi:hypothetical protein